MENPPPNSPEVNPLETEVTLPKRIQYLQKRIHSLKIVLKNLTEATRDCYEEYRCAIDEGPPNHERALKIKQQWLEVTNTIKNIRLKISFLEKRLIVETAICRALGSIARKGKI